MHVSAGDVEMRLDSTKEFQIETVQITRNSLSINHNKKKQSSNVSYSQEFNIVKFLSHFFVRSGQSFMKKNPARKNRVFVELGLDEIRESSTKR